MGKGTVYKRIKRLFEKLAALERAQEEAAARNEKKTDTGKDGANMASRPADNSSRSAGTPEKGVLGAVEVSPRTD